MKITAQKQVLEPKAEKIQQAKTQAEQAAEIFMTLLYGEDWREQEKEAKYIG